MSHPYAGLPSRAFWRSAIAEPSMLELHDIYRPRFEISRELPIAAAGSCFAQHIGRQFKVRGFRFLDEEPAHGFLPESVQHRYGYGLYSARYGNVYSIRQMRQLLERAHGEFTPIEQVWESDGRFYDPFRPAIEPGGVESPDEVLAAARSHLAAVRRLFEHAGLVVFTFGLTEGWLNREDGSAYPTSPGTVAGTWDPTKYEFHNFTFSEVLADAEAVIARLVKLNPEMKFLFTVSPVPLTATASDQHVLPATIYSKSVLRAVCGDLYQRYENVDYFPSYELVASHPMRAMFFEPNLRSVARSGVAQVMEHFFRAHGETGGPQASSTSQRGSADPGRDEDDVVCEEELLEVFGR